MHRSVPASMMFAAGFLAVAPSWGGDVSISSGDSWRFAARVVAQTPSGVYGLAAGDIDAARAGIEIAAMTGDGRILVLTPAAGVWGVEAVASGIDTVNDPRWRPTIAVGDFHSGSDGPEIVASYPHYTVGVRRAAPGTWTADIVRDRTIIFGASWGTRAGDIDPHHAGDELIILHEAAGDFGSLFIAREIDGAYVEEYVPQTPWPVMMDSRVGEFDSAHPGRELALVTEMEPAGELIPPAAPGGDWSYRPLWDDYENAGWVVTTGEVDPMQAGPELVVGTRYENRILVANANAAGAVVPQVVFDGAASVEIPSMLDVVATPLIAGLPGSQIVGVDFAGRAHLVWRDESAWRSQSLLSSTEPLLAAAAGRFVAGCGTEQVLVAGQSGTIWLIAARPEGDLDGDAGIGLSDLAMLLAHFGATGGASYEQGDVDEDGDVDLTDLARLLRVFGSRCL